MQAWGAGSCVTMHLRPPQRRASFSLARGATEPVVERASGVRYALNVNEGGLLDAPKSPSLLSRSEEDWLSRPSSSSSSKALRLVDMGDRGLERSVINFDPDKHHVQIIILVSYKSSHFLPLRPVLVAVYILRRSLLLFLFLFAYQSLGTCVYAGTVRPCLRHRRVTRMGSLRWGFGLKCTMRRSRYVPFISL
jgi:hypothetical protein